MYDLQIICPCVKERIHLLEKTMFFNINDKKVLFYCLISKDYECFEKANWPENLDVKLIKYENKNENYMLFDFLSKLTEEDAKNALWTIKLDDDCYNNIELTCNFLNNKFNYLENYYITSFPVRNENGTFEIQALKNCDLFKKIDEYWTHEIEYCALSQGTFCKIISNPECKKLFKAFAEINNLNRKGYTDQLLGAAAKLCNIFPMGFKNIICNTKNIQEEEIIHFHSLNFPFLQNLIGCNTSNEKRTCETRIL